MLQSTEVYALQGTDTLDFQITAPGTMTGEWTAGLEGMQSVAVELRFLWGSGGTTVKALVQSAMGPDGPAYDIAQVTFDVVARTVMFELYAGTTDLVDPGVGGIDASGNPETDGLLCNVLGDRLRLVAIVTGSYLNTVLSARVLPK
ncbi:MAG TPA: hypothetical protein VL614_00430 [Acetobacteraceae bacterium]|jgi:hypothetical protein|nr:hypothetical protein [Acetobacteraceae bacterium]